MSAKIHTEQYSPLELTMLRKGKDKKSLLTFLLQQGSLSLLLAATSRRCNCSLRFDFVRADADIASFSFSSFIRATARACSSSTSIFRRRNSAFARFLSASACARSSSRLNKWKFHLFQLNLLYPCIAGRIVHTFDHLYFSCVASSQNLLLLFLLGNLQCMAPRNYAFYKIP